MTDTPPTAPPIVVNATPVPDQLQAAARQAALILGPLAAVAAQSGKLHLAGWLNLVITILGPAAALASLVMGQIKTRHDSQRQTVMADKLDDSIAKVK